LPREAHVHGARVAVVTVHIVRTAIGVGNLQALTRKAEVIGTAVTVVTVLIVYTTIGDDFALAAPVDAGVVGTHIRVFAFHIGHTAIGNRGEDTGVGLAACVDAGVGAETVAIRNATRGVVHAQAGIGDAAVLGTRVPIVTRRVLRAAVGLLDELAYARVRVADVVGAGVAVVAIRGGRTTAEYRLRLAFIPLTAVRRADLIVIAFFVV